MKTRCYLLAGIFLMVGLSSAWAGFGDKQVVDLNVFLE
jgi:hypothetical protein